MFKDRLRFCLAVVSSLYLAVVSTKTQTGQCPVCVFRFVQFVSCCCVQIMSCYIVVVCTALLQFVSCCCKLLRSSGCRGCRQVVCCYDAVHQQSTERCYSKAQKVLSEVPHIKDTNIYKGAGDDAKILID